MQYSLLAFNVHRLWRRPRVMELSLVKTLANKVRTKARQMYQSYRQTSAPRPGNLRVLEVTGDRGTTKQPRGARCGGIELRGQKHIVLEAQPKLVYRGLRSEVVQRLLAQKCELCESEDGLFQVHHVRKLADLDRPGQGEKPLWVKRMASRRRKTLVVCQRCHEEIHRERPPRRKKRGQVTGEPR